MTSPSSASSGGGPSGRPISAVIGDRIAPGLGRQLEPVRVRERRIPGDRRVDRWHRAACPRRAPCRSRTACRRARSSGAWPRPAARAINEAVHDSVPPCTTDGSAALISANKPAHAITAASISARLGCFHGLSGKRSSSSRASSNAAMARSGYAERKLLRARASAASSLAEPGTRDQSVTTPSSGECSIGSPASTLKYSSAGPRWLAAPKPWLLCMLRLSAASSPHDKPRCGL